MDGGSDFKLKFPIIYKVEKEPPKVKVHHVVHHHHHYVPKPKKCDAPTIVVEHEHETVEPEDSKEDKLAATIAETLKPKK